MAHVLIVEDDRWMASCYERWLAANNHTAVICNDPQAALDAMDVSRPDAIMLDLLLPRANGVQLLHNLQSYGDLATIPVILCSSSLPEDLPDVSLYGVRKVMAKSALNPRTLCAAVQEVLHAAV